MVIKYPALDGGVIFNIPTFMFPHSQVSAAFSLLISVEYQFVLQASHSIIVFVLYCGSGILVQQQLFGVFKSFFNFRRGNFVSLEFFVV